MKDIRKIYLGFAIIVFVLLAAMNWDSVDRSYVSYQILSEVAIPNTVSAIYLKTRLYDTIFEVMVFSVSIAGALYFLGNRTKFRLENYLTVDPATAIIFKVAAYLSFIFGWTLAFAGHLSPGGGFAAGVAIGTSMVIQSLVNDRNRLIDHLSGERPEKIEKFSWICIILIASLTFFGVVPPEGYWGGFFSGGWIPVLNILIGAKVGLGTWALSLGFLDHRWIF